MKKVLLPLFAFVALLCIASIPAQAAACFTWSCDHATGACTFNASCSTANPYVWKYNFDWGDGSSTGLVGSPNQSHTFSSGSDSRVTLYVHAFQEPVTQTVSCWVYHHPWQVSPPAPSSGTCQ